MHKALLFIPTILLSGCYTVQQGYHQAKLILRREKIADVLKEQKEDPSRLQKLSVVPQVLSFAEREVGLTPGGSYQHFVPLEGRYVVYTVQAAEKRRLKFKTWWFPFVGSQPYLGFFKKEDAVKFKNELDKAGFDTSTGGVEAFSLLGYFSDPVYSSMLDGNSLPDLVETLFHESLHRTMYIANFSSFNENLADFIAKKATVEFFQKHPDLNIDVSEYEKVYLKTLNAQKHFKKFLIKTKKEIDQFYEVNKDLSDTELEKKRSDYFDEIANSYQTEVSAHVAGTNYERAFQKGKINNAVLLAYSLYEANQEPFDAYYANFEHLKPFIKSLQTCLNRSFKNEQQLWDTLEGCTAKTKK